MVRFYEYSKKIFILLFSLFFFFKKIINYPLRYSRAPDENRIVEERQKENKKSLELQ